MPRFSNAVLTCLKRGMLPRVPACYFTPEDVEKVMGETGLDKSSVTQWAEFLRWRIKSDKIENLDGFLRSTDGDQKVT